MAASLYPIFLKLEGEHALVVGGGTLARRKTQDLLVCGARVHVVAPDWRDDFDALAGNGSLTRSTRRFEHRDLDGVRLVVAATDEPAVHDDVAGEALRRGIPCNVVDVNPLCSYYVPAVFRRGSLTVAIATDGKFPLLAAAVRDRIAQDLGPALAPALERLAEGRELAFTRWPEDPGARLAALRRLLTPEALERIVEGRLDAFDRHWETWKATLEIAS